MAAGVLVVPRQRDEGQREQRCAYYPAALLDGPVVEALACAVEPIDRGHMATLLFPAFHTFSLMLIRKMILFPHSSWTQTLPIAPDQGT
ncbi:protein of unknown function (plasmid) [Cupriavidus taiwanensis]|uniref:Uncharacterized protein n=1 Tax=Cupriavidus taiwanensis TaxID=164546 RepID=A0A375EEB2_9BURK|nr:protein of unknown function [Cupriavidus taiwanensis]SOZ74587.1 protein of unknown function [Cupriavidus taiwanensis]SPD49136.1 protein of unknown function [Cupriavidus taiwanensis]